MMNCDLVLHEGCLDTVSHDSTLSLSSLARSIVHLHTFQSTTPALKLVPVFSPYTHSCFDGERQGERTAEPSVDVDRVQILSIRSQIQ